MEGGNEVDLSNNNISPLWKRQSANHTGPSKLKARPLSYQIDRLHMTDLPVEDNKCGFTLSQPAERLVATPGGGTVILKHVLNQPTRRTRVVRSISIGHLAKGRFSLSKFKSEDKFSSLDNKAHHGGSAGQIGNKEKVWSDKRPRDALKRLSSPFTLTSHRDQIVFGTSSSLPDRASSSHPSPPATPNNNHHHNLTSSSSYHPLTPHPSPPSLHTPTPSHSSTCSISSLTSTSTPSDPPTPRSPSPADMSAPSLSPPPSIVLSTHSAAALKMGTQQLIPKGLASLSKASPAGVQSQGLGGLLGLDPTKRALRAVSMVETGSFFSTDGGGEGTDQDESPGSLKRGLRSTSYRRAVVSGVEVEVPSVDPKTHLLSQSVDPKTHLLSQSVLKGLQEVKETPTSPGKKNKRPDKKPGLITQRTFDREEEELYQNYQEKALHNDSDEDQSREPKPDEGIVVQYRPIRTSWSQLSVVKKSGLKLSQEERKRQEAIFELISSEHSYLHSLEVLIRMFQNSAELSDTMTKTEHHHLFSNITDVCEASKKFFKELEDLHQQNVVIDDISDIVFRHAQSNFDPYITYCSNEVYQQRTLQRLVSKSPVFKEVLTRIEGHPDCRNLPMISFLILPMQRVTRLPLLMDVICQKASKGSSQYEACKKALQSVSKVVRQCNEGARTMERTEMMYTINSQLDFKIKPFPLVSSSRWMVKRGELTAFVEENGIFSKRTSRHQVYFFLFNDVLILTRKKSEDSYAVIDYALRDHIWVGPCQAQDINLSPIRTTAGMLTSRHPGASHLFHLRFRSNHSGDKVPMVLGVELMNERARWITALGQSSNDEKNQDRTNAMQVVVTRTYTAKQPDELSLQVADVVLVSQTVEDGWYEGERLRDGERGWFLSECAEPITCQATIERNVQRMDRLQGLETNV
ncbi:rho guanine nucleotide exchange factor 26 [Oncorhynchus mykiss]|uniref:Rho guanine nucleotide exchange factor 26 n=1 Tax=Oncorhynchus mykiss TaxID=8022 RepID=A0A8K9UBL0_ONCMY|nr:rho guanine nucleotide exchange factor 26 [Oncorhynchus mykiss]XP_036817228.1 rho guanine nucleotide exchange factor 26 [Oncorhynchus mykiss]